MTILLGLEFLRQTALEWHHLIAIASDHHHQSVWHHFLLAGWAARQSRGARLDVVVANSVSLGCEGVCGDRHRRFELLAWYWHFVDAVWVAVFTVVYVIGR